MAAAALETRVCPQCCQEFALRSRGQLLCGNPACAEKSWRKPGPKKKKTTGFDIEPDLELGSMLYPEEDYQRPRTRGDCADICGFCPTCEALVNAARGEPCPSCGTETVFRCPFVLCEYHLYLDVLKTGSLRICHPDKEPWELEETCALDVADQGGLTLEEVGRLMNVTREYIRQLEEKSILRAKRSALRLGIRLENLISHSPKAVHPLAAAQGNSIGYQSMNRAKPKPPVAARPRPEQQHKHVLDWQKHRMNVEPVEEEREEVMESSEMKQLIDKVEELEAGLTKVGSKIEEHQKKISALRVDEGYLLEERDGVLKRLATFGAVQRMLELLTGEQQKPEPPAEVKELLPKLNIRAPMPPVKPPQDDGLPMIEKVKKLLLKNPSRSFTVKEAADSVKWKKHTVGITLAKLAQKGVVQRVEKGVYRAAQKELAAA